MPTTDEKNPMFMMPTVFGPSTSPRRGEGGIKFEWKDSPRRVQSRLTFRTNPEAIREILPQGYELTGEPLITFSFAYIKELEWLAGRGYNIMFVFIPGITFRGKQASATGTFLPVLWENLTEPILTGREELGYSKIFCDLPEIRWLGDSALCSASWDGFSFAEMRLTDLVELSEAEMETASKAAPAGDGILHYKYIPKTGEWGTGDIGQTVLTPNGNSNARITRMWKGRHGTMKINRATWEQMPTQYMIVNGIANFELKEFVSATITETIGGKDLSDQRIVEIHENQK